MKQRIFLIFFVLLATISGFAKGVVDEKGAPTPELLKLLTLLQVPHDHHLESIVKMTQQMWVEPGKERWELQEKQPEKKAMAWPLLKAIGCIDAIHAQEKEYDYALVLGALRSRIELRLAFLYREWQNGVRFKEIVFLTGQRDLNAQMENIPQGIASETELMKFLYDSLNFSPEFRAIPLKIIDAPKQIREGGCLKRPNTADTVMLWLAQNPKPGKCLIISDQPFVTYQDAVLRLLLPQDFQVETIGDSAQENLPFAVYLDNLAKWLLQEQMILEFSL